LFAFELMCSPQSVESLKLKVLSKNLLLILSTQHFLLSTQHSAQSW
jgi:hypothetical protein